MTAISDDIRFQCKQCGQNLVVEAAGAGVASSCPTCNMEVTVPTPDAESLPASRTGLATTPAPEALEAPFADRAAPESQEESPSERLVAELRAAREEIGQLQQQLKTLGERHEHLTASTTHTQAELKTFQTERQQLKSELSTVRQRLSATDEALARRDAEHGEVSAQLAETRASLAEWKANAEAADSTLEAFQKSTADLGHTFAAEVQRREALEASHAALTQRSAATESTLGGTREEIERLAAELRDGQRNLDEARQQLAAAAGVKAQLDEAEWLLGEQREKSRQAEETIQTMTARCDELRREGDTLRRDLQDSHAGREILEIRAQLDAAGAEKDRTTARIASLEADLHSVNEAAATLRAGRDAAERERDAAVAEAASLRESRSIKDNEVLRGIVARQNTDLVQRTAEVTRMKRARYALKLAYVLFGIGLLGVVAFALKVLPTALRH